MSMGMAFRGVITTLSELLFGRAASDKASANCSRENRCVISSATGRIRENTSLADSAWRSTAALCCR